MINISDHVIYFYLLKIGSMYSVCRVYATCIIGIPKYVRINKLYIPKTVGSRTKSLKLASLNLLPIIARNVMVI